MSDNVLIVEDEANLRLVIRETLLIDKAEYSVDDAADGLEALEKLRTGSYDLVLSDILMPRMDGIELLGVLREDIRLAVEEIGLNAVEWGNRNEHGKRVHLSYQLYDDRITFRVEDEGSGFLPDALPDPSVDPVAHIERRQREGKRVGGFGIHIVRKLMDEVRFSEKGNSVVMTKRLSLPRAG